MLIGAKQALLVLAALWTAVVTLLHLRLPPECNRARLRSMFITGSAAVGLVLAGVTAMVLLLGVPVALLDALFHHALSLAAVRHARVPLRLYLYP